MDFQQFLQVFAIRKFLEPHFQLISPIRWGSFASASWSDASSQTWRFMKELHVAPPDRNAIYFIRTLLISAAIASTAALWGSAFRLLASLKSLNWHRLVEWIVQLNRATNSSHFYLYKQVTLIHLQLVSWTYWTTQSTNNEWLKKNTS